MSSLFFSVQVPSPGNGDAHRVSSTAISLIWIISHSHVHRLDSQEIIVLVKLTVLTISGSFVCGFGFFWGVGFICFIVCA